MLKSTYSDQHYWPPFLNLAAAYNAPLVIESLEVRRFNGTYLVRATSADGAVGMATANRRMAYLVPMFTQLVAPAFIGRDARELETLINEVYTFGSNYKYQGTPLWNCVAYAEAALLDLLGQASGRSVGQLVGTPYRQRIPIYLSSMRRDTTAEAEVEWIGQRLAETGATGVKLKIGGRMANNADSLPGRAEQLLERARTTWGPDIALYADANGSYDHVRAIEIGRLMESLEYAFFEEPCPFEQYEETQAVADALSIDVAGGEQDCNMGLFRTMIRQRTVDVIQPDLMYNGGLIRALRVAQMAAEAGIPVTPHSPKHNPELATLLHFASVVEHTGPHLEFPAAPVSYADWYAPHFTIEEGGYIRVPTGPGLGIEYEPGTWDRAEAVE